MQVDPRVAIIGLGTATPPHQAKQSEVIEWMSKLYADQPVQARWLRSIFANAGVETRYTCVADYLQAGAASRFFSGTPVRDAPTTAERMTIYQRESTPLGVAAARTALSHLAASSGATPEAVRNSITHLVAVSCTGFFAPGLDFMIAQQLELPPTVKRTLIGFMGCSAAFNALQIAHDMVRSQPAARVLIVCVELCSLHTQPGMDREQLIAAALFGDGASACIVGAPTADQGNFYVIEELHSEVKSNTQDEMVWRIGDQGFQLRLSPQIPAHLAEVAPSAIGSLFSTTRPTFWAIHPGGPAILDQLTNVFTLAPDDVRASRSVLQRVGNLSSATIFFVLEAMRQQLSSGEMAEAPQVGVAMAFGPGVVIEMARLLYVPAYMPVDAALMGR